MARQSSQMRDPPGAVTMLAGELFRQLDRIAILFGIRALLTAERREPERATPFLRRDREAPTRGRSLGHFDGAFGSAHGQERAAVAGKARQAAPLSGRELLAEDGQQSSKQQPWPEAGDLVRLDEHRPPVQGAGDGRGHAATLRR